MATIMPTMIRPANPQKAKAKISINNSIITIIQGY